MGADAPIPPIKRIAAAPKGAPRRPQDFFLMVIRNRDGFFIHTFANPVICPAVPRRGPEAGSHRNICEKNRMR